MFIPDLQLLVGCGFDGVRRRRKGEFVGCFLTRGISADTHHELVFTQT